MLDGQVTKADTTNHGIFSSIKSFFVLTSHPWPHTKNVKSEIAYVSLAVIYLKQVSGEIFKREISMVNLFVVFVLETRQMYSHFIFPRNSSNTTREHVQLALFLIL